MKKKVFGRKLSRSSKSRRGLFRSLVRAIVINGEIKTTYAKAKFLLPEFEKLINVAKKNDIAGRRRIYATLANDREITDKIFEIAKSFTGRSGGYIKTVNLPARRGDAARIVKLSWTEKIEVGDKKSKISKKREKIEKNKEIEKGKGKVKENKIKKSNLK